MSNPLDTNSFKHYLKFISLGSVNLYEINEPIGFDSATFTLEQESKRSARSLQYGSLSKLTFVDATTDLIEERVINPQGDTSTYLDYCLQFLLHIYKTYGFEAKVEYILEQNGVQFSNGMLDFTDKDITDGETFISCKLIQNNNVQNVKRRFDDKFNAFSDKDVNENTITPIPTIKYLRKATPIQLTSKWTNVNKVYSFSGANRAFNPFRQIVDSEIKNTLTIYEDYIAWNGTGANPFTNFAFINNKTKLNNVKLKFKLKGKVTRSGGSLLNEIRMRCFHCKEEDFSDTLATDTPLYIIDFTTETEVNFDTTIEHEFSNVPIGEKIYFMFNYSRISGGGDITFQLENSEFTIVATSTGTNQVINVVRNIDLMKQASKFNQNIPINAPLFDIEGIHYNNFLFNKRMVTQRTDYLYTTPKEVFENVVEVNCDYEIKEDEIFIGNSQDDFYTNDEIGVFNIIPSEDFSVYENDKAQINKFTYGYKSYEQDRTTIGTSESFNTESEWRFLNENVENVKEVKVDFVRDSKAIQKAVDLEITQPTTSTNDDDKLYIENGTQLAPNSIGGDVAIVAFRYDGGILEVLNNEIEGDASDITFIWTNLGLSIGATFTIEEGENIGTYTILEITNNILKLSPLVATPDYNGNAIIKYSFVYTGVFWTTRTNQGFSLIEGIDTSFGNIAYSIKRNMQYFKKYFAMCLLYAKKNITLGYFKNNGSVKTQLLTETEPLIENAPILYNSLPTPVISPKVYNFSVYAEFSDIYNLLELYKTKRGFIRGLNSKGKVIKGYIQKLEHNWSENKAEVTIEERFETEYLVLTYADGVLFVNDAPYNLSGVANWWRFKNDYLQLFDEKSRPISNGYKFNFVILNGISYNSKLDLTNALINL